VLLSLALAACGSPADPSGDETSGGSTSSSSTSTSTETSGGFVPEYDEFVSECDGFAQDCPDGEKCVPYSFMGTHFDATKCVPVMGDQAPGEPCVHGGITEATDDCDETSGCFYVDEVDGELVGFCYAFCLGSEDDPQCPAGSSCMFGSDPIPAFCVITCDPLAQDCSAGLGCYFTNVNFSCIPPTTNIPAGEPCGFIDACAPGLVCISTDVLPACNDAACCSPFCSLSVGDAPCEAVPGTICEPFFEEGFAPPGYEDIGACVVPPP
jgi:hypothetical protein